MLIVQFGIEAWLLSLLLRPWQPARQGVVVIEAAGADGRNGFLVVIFERVRLAYVGQPALTLALGGLLTWQELLTLLP